MQRITYYDAALRVLQSADRPLSTHEITDLALEQGMILPVGKTPHATMSATLYTRVGKDSEIVKIDVPGNGRAKRGSVRWALRSG